LFIWPNVKFSTSNYKYSVLLHNCSVSCLQVKCCFKRKSQLQQAYSEQKEQSSQWVSDCLL